MAKLKLNHIYKEYPNGVVAVSDFCMEIEDKEFIVFVGPSGCGKSTTLRMIAGLEEITKGELFIGDKYVNDTEPKDRNIAMVFQSYALYPHLTVFDNIAFGLRLKNFSDAEINKRVREAAKLLDIEQLLERKPKVLSGGQRQRVALGRAIVREPEVFLLDEPLSNLDAKLRILMRAEISKLHKKLGTTFIYVTHDQIEAMTMGTRIVVMKDGFIQQIDTPQNIYNKPGNMFVAGFMGSPQMNFFDAVLIKEGENIIARMLNREMILTHPKIKNIKEKYLDGNTPVKLGIRAEDIYLADDSKDKNSPAVKAVISAVEVLGSETFLYTEQFSLKVSPTAIAHVGDEITVTFDAGRVHLFDPETTDTIT